MAHRIKNIPAPNIPQYVQTDMLTNSLCLLVTHFKRPSFPYLLLQSRYNKQCGCLGTYSLIQCKEYVC